MAYYNICQYCNAHLDPGERCDCRDRQETAKTVRAERRETVKIIYSRPGKAARYGG